MTCTQAVQSTYNFAKRRIVFVRKLPVGVRRRFALSPISQSRSRQRRFSWHYRIPEQPTQSSSTIVSTLLPERMQSVEHNILFNISPIPASSNTVAWDATILPSTFDASASYSGKVNGAFLHNPSPSPSKFLSSPNELLSSLDAPHGAKSHGHQSRLTPTGFFDIKQGFLPHVTSGPHNWATCQSNREIRQRQTDVFFRGRQHLKNVSYIRARREPDSEGKRRQGLEDWPTHKKW